ncbi:helix-turn-helix domain-containing protein [Mycetocola reblochoni]|nr:helix-turn-helix domain-containing protein [Mycetocola reblochoni]
MAITDRIAPALMTFTDASEAAGLDWRTIKAGVQSGAIPTVKFGKRQLIPREAFMRIIAGDSASE